MQGQQLSYRLWLLGDKMLTRQITATLPAGSVYVSGTVNSVAATWTQGENNTWSAVVPRAENDIYHVSLTIIGTNGVSTKSEFTLYYGASSLITWRTQADVNRAKYLRSLWGPSGFTGTDEEKAEWLGNLIGCYNASDLNRVGAAVEYLTGWLNGLGYAVEATAKTNWTMKDTPTSGQMQQYLDAVSIIRSAIAVLPATPPVPEDMEKLTFNQANDIEQILTDVNLLLENIERSYIYSGEVYAGEV